MTPVLHLHPDPPMRRSVPPLSAVKSAQIARCISFSLRQLQTPLFVNYLESYSCKPGGGIGLFHVFEWTQERSTSGRKNGRLLLRIAPLEYWWRAFNLSFHHGGELWRIRLFMWS